MRVRWQEVLLIVGLQAAGGIPFEEKMKKLTAELAGQMEEETKLNKEIKKQLENIGFKP